LRTRVKAKVKQYGISVDVRLEGSIAKDTWLKHGADIDIFLLIPSSVKREKLTSVYLPLAKESMKGFRWTERYAEHPYLHVQVAAGIDVNIVPCYDVEPPEWKSATDRTPFHTKYVKENLGNDQKRDVRLLKRFMKGIGVYGADIKIGGFSGYLSELLIINYGGFLPVLKASCKWKVGEVIDYEKYYGDRTGEVGKLFDEQLIVIDPVDKCRNVASAVTPKAFDIFRTAANFFLKKPSLAFFYPQAVKPYDFAKLCEVIKSSKADFLFLEFGWVSAVPDILWGQLYKTQRALSNLLKQHNFNVLRSAVWSDEEKSNVIIFELEASNLGGVMKHYGPPALSIEEDRFILKYLSSSKTVSGPSVEGGRWAVLIERKYRNAVFLIREKLANASSDVGAGSRVVESLGRGFKVMLNCEILKFYKKNPDFAIFLTDFLRGKPNWLF
jgi:tRNA nucleotidyltransferase (CCA-adding enzyme)